MLDSLCNNIIQDVQPTLLFNHCCCLLWDYLELLCDGDDAHGIVCSCDVLLIPMRMAITNLLFFCCARWSNRRSLAKSSDGKHVSTFAFAVFIALARHNFCVTHIFCCNISLLLTWRHTLEPRAQSDYAEIYKSWVSHLSAEREKNVQRDNSDTRSGEEEGKTAQVLALIGA